MSGLQVMGIYLLGLMLGGLLGFMVARRLYGRETLQGRPQPLAARWSQRFWRAIGGGSPGVARSGKSRPAEHSTARGDERRDASGAAVRAHEPDRLADDLQSEAARATALPARPGKPTRILRWWRRRTVEAEEFVVRDSTGMRRAKLGMSVDGWVRLRLFDKSGERCVSLGVDPEGYARLRLYDQRGEPRAGLAVFPDSAGEGLVLNDQAGNPRMTFSLLDDGVPDLRILDAGGKVLWKAP